MKEYIEEVKLSIDRGFPFVVIETGNYQMVCKDLDNAGFTHDLAGKQLPTALLHWDMPVGAVALNGSSAEGILASQLMNQKKEPAITTSKFEECLARAVDLMPRGTILIMDDVHLLLEHRDETLRALYIQSIRNCRDAFKSSQRALIFLVPKVKLPVELNKDMAVVVAPMPTEEDRKAMATEICKAAGVEPPSDLKEVSNILRGLTEFGAENLLAMAIEEGGFNLNILRRGSIAAVNAVAGLSVIESKMTFDSIMGLSQVKKFGQMKADGKDRPMAVVLIDEITDQMSGRGDSNGINRDAQGQMLQYMQNCRWKGSLFHGIAGTGKTQISGAIANACNGMFINWDFGAMKGGIVSESERAIRAALGTLWDRFGERVMFIGTTNSVDELTPQMKRRFGVIYYFDVLDKAQQAPIWEYFKKKFGLADSEMNMPDYAGWTGAEIERCCEYAWEFEISLLEAAQFVTPVVVSMGDGVDKMREEAAGKYLDANAPGYFQTKRALDLKEVRAFIKKPGKINPN